MYKMSIFFYVKFTKKIDFRTKWIRVNRADWKSEKIN